MQREHLPINQNQAHFALLDTQTGGNGQPNFALSDLRGRTPMHSDAGRTLGKRGGPAVMLGRDFAGVVKQAGPDVTRHDFAYILGAVEGGRSARPPTCKIPILQIVVRNV